MRIIRVFPSRNSYTPGDDMVFIGLPPFLLPDHDEVHISCTFSWDKKECEWLKYQWEVRTDKPVRLGGPALHERWSGARCISKRMEGIPKKLEQARNNASEDERSKK